MMLRSVQATNAANCKKSATEWLSSSLMLGLLASFFVRYTQKHLAKRLQAYPPAKLLSLPSGPTHVITAGDPQDPPILLIHGSDGVALDWPTCPLWPLINKGAYLIAVDRPGHGYTPVADGQEVTVAMNSQRLKELLQALNLRQVTVVAHSYGGSVAMKLAHDCPDLVRSLVLLAPLGLPSAELTRPLAFVPLVPPLRWLLTRCFPLPIGKVVLDIEGRNAFYPQPMPRIWKNMMKAFSMRREQVLALTCENRNISRELRALQPALRHLRQPVSIFYGPHDRLANPQQQAIALSCVLPNAKLRRLEGGGHELHWSHPEAIAQAIHEQLRQP